MILGFEFQIAQALISVCVIVLVVLLHLLGANEERKKQTHKNETSTARRAKWCCGSLDQGGFCRNLKEKY